MLLLPTADVENFDWSLKYFVLTNVALLEFENENLSKPLHVIALHEMKLIQNRNRKVDKRDHTFALKP